MLRVSFKYATRMPFTEAHDGKTHLLSTLSFVASKSDKTGWARLELSVPSALGGVEVLYKYITTGGPWAHLLFQRRVMLERALKEYFNASPDEFDEHLLLISSEHVQDGKVVYST